LLLARGVVNWPSACRHADIHWRTDSDYSMLLGEAMAISYLNDLAQPYREKFSITLTKLDGNPVTISNK
jgi:hypothetical protein